MMASTEPTLSAELAELLKPLEARREALVSELATLREREGELQDQLRQIDRVMKAGGLMEPNPRQASQNGSAAKATKKGTSVAPWREEQIQKHMAENPTKAFSVAILAEQLGWNKATTSLAVNQARAHGLIRLAGRMPDHKNAKAYRVVT